MIGANNQAGKSLLKTEYGAKPKSDDDDDAPEKMETEEDPAEEEIRVPDVTEALRLAVKVLSKTMDGTVPSPEKMELFTMTLAEDVEGCVHHILTEEESKKVVDDVEAEAASAGDA